MVLVKGYLGFRDLGERLEVLYAVFPNGQILKCTKEISHYFNEKKAKWEKTSELPIETEFIGHYYMNEWMGSK